jgi:hypothetical protein
MCCDLHGQAIPAWIAARSGMSSHERINCFLQANSPWRTRKQLIQPLSDRGIQLAAGHQLVDQSPRMRLSLSDGERPRRRCGRNTPPRGDRYFLDISNPPNWPIVLKMPRPAGTALRRRNVPGMSGQWAENSSCRSLGSGEEAGKPIAIVERVHAKLPVKCAAKPPFVSKTALHGDLLEA